MLLYTNSFVKTGRLKYVTECQSVCIVFAKLFAFSQLHRSVACVIIHVSLELAIQDLTKRVFVFNYKVGYAHGTVLSDTHVGVYK